MKKYNKKQTESENHFDMSGAYERNSLSQHKIGRTVIETAVDLIKDKQGELKGIDLACGPGNLTIELKNLFRTACPDARINLTGVDYTEKNVERLAVNSNREINGLVGSFFSLPFKPESMDFIVSNEGLHWQPTYDMPAVIHSHLSMEERKEYEEWAQVNFQKAVLGICETLRTGGIAVLQFGSKGQLQKLWDLIRDVLENERFRKYKPKVNFPLYYPSPKNIESAFIKAGCTNNNSKIKLFKQDLEEHCPHEITQFLKAFTEPCFRTFFEPDDLNAFYFMIENWLSKMDVEDFRKDQWRRTLIQVAKDWF